MVMLTETRPASVARTQVVTGGRDAVAKYVQHPSIEGKQVLQAVEVPPERVAVLSAILERRETERITFGSDKPAVGHEADWLTEKLGRGEHRIGAFGVVLTVGKGLSMLASTDPVVAAAVHDALREGASAYHAYVADHAMTRIGPEGRQEHVAIDPASLRAVGWLHGHSAAGDPHQHAHLLIGTTIQVGNDPRPRAIHTKHFLDEVAQEAEGAARVAMIRTLKAHGLAVDPLSLDLAGIDSKTLKALDRFSKMREIVKEAEAHGLSHNAAWKAARRAVGKDTRQPLADDLDPLTEQIQAWAGMTWTVPTAEGDIQLRLSKVEALEHALDALSRTDEGRKVVVEWQQERSGGAFLRAIAELERIRLAAQDQRQELTPIEARQIAETYLIRLGQAAEKGQVLTREALTSHAQAIAEVHPELPFEQVNAWLQNNFVEHPTRRRGLIAVAELKADIELAEKAMQVLAPAKTVQEALRHSVGLTVIQGVAGAGKTTAVVEAARERWARERGQIWTLSRNAKTADDLGLAAETALREVGGDPKRVHHVSLANPAWWDNIKPGDRVVVDEFALAERRDLLKLIAVATRCPVTLLGDTWQQRAIEQPTAAQVLGHIAEAAGQPNLADTMRCKAWRDLHDDLRRAPSDEQASDRTLADLDIRTVSSAAEAARVAQREGATLFALTNERVAEAATSIQRAQDGPTIKVQYGVKVGVGEQVVFHAIVRDERMHVLGKTGEVATVVAVTDVGVMLRRENGNLEAMRLEQAREHLGPASAQTIDSAQGRTVEKAAVLLTGTEDAHAAYTAATRGKQAPIVFVLQEQEQDERTRAAEQQHLDPREVVREVLARSDRGTFLGLADEDRQALVDKLHTQGNHDVAARLENLEARLERIAEQRQAQEQAQRPEPVQEPVQRPEPVVEPEPVLARPQERPERPQEQAQELDEDERIRREVERQWEQTWGEREPVQEHRPEPDRRQEDRRQEDRRQTQGQDQEQELDDDERIRREVERQWEEMERRQRLRRERERRRQQERGQEKDDVPLMPGYDTGQPGIGGGWGLGL